MLPEGLWRRVGSHWEDSTQLAEPMGPVEVQLVGEARDVLLPCFQAKGNRSQ